MKDSTSLSKILLTAAGIAALFVFWLILSAAKDNDMIFPHWGSIFSAMGGLLTDGTVMKFFLLSFGRLMLTLVLGFITSVVIVFLYVLYPPSYSFFKPLLVIMKAAPLAVISVYLWIAAGAKIGPYIITYLVITPLFTEGMKSGIDTVPKEYKNELALEKTSVFRKFFCIYIPLILPVILMNLLQCFGLGMKVLMMAEYICQTPDSVGRIIYDYKADLDFAHLIAILIIVIVLVLLTELGVNACKKKFIAENT